MQLPGPLLCPGSKKKKKPRAPAPPLHQKKKKKKKQKKTIFQKMKLSGPPKKSNKTSLKCLASKSLIKNFYTLDKTPKGETGF